MVHLSENDKHGWWHRVSCLSSPTPVQVHPQYPFVTFWRIWSLRSLRKGDQLCQQEPRLDPPFGSQLGQFRTFHQIMNTTKIILKRVQIDMSVFICNTRVSMKSVELCRLHLKQDDAFMFESKSAFKNRVDLIICFTCNNEFYKSRELTTDSLHIECASCDDRDNQQLHRLVILLQITGGSVLLDTLQSGGSGGD